MPAPAPTPPAATPAQRTRLSPPRLLAAVAFAAVGFVAVWQGFGLAGYGTDLHVRRVFVAVAILFAAAMPLVWPNTRLAVRALAVLIGLAGAGYAWWEFPDSNFKSAMSLREAVEGRDRYRDLLANATVEDIKRYEGLRGITLLTDQYPSLTKDLAPDYARWKDRMWTDIRTRYERTPP